MGPEQIERDSLEDEAIVNMAKRVRAEEDPEFTEQYERAVRGEPGGRHAAGVEIRTTSGEVLRSGPVEGNIKYPPEGWGLERIEDKFRRFVGGARPAVEELLSWVRSISELDDLRGYSRGLEL